MQRLEELLAAGADCERPDARGQIALVAAALRGDAVVVRRLLAAGARVDALNGNGVSALIAAAHQGHVAVVRELLAAGCEVDLVNQAGATALVAAVEADQSVAEILIEARLELATAVSDRLRTPFFHRFSLDFHRFSLDFIGCPCVGRRSVRGWSRCEPRPWSRNLHVPTSPGHGSGLHAAAHRRTGGPHDDAQAALGARRGAEGYAAAAGGAARLSALGPRAAES